VATIAHQERPDYLDRLSVLRNQVFVLDHMYMSVFATCGWILRLAVVVGLLVSIHPALAALALFALPTVLTSTWRPGVERVAEERGAPDGRLARHLFLTATTAPPGKEVRVTRIGERLVRQRREAGSDGRARVGRPLEERGVAHLAGDLWRRLRRRDRLRGVGPAGAPGSAPRARRGFASRRTSAPPSARSIPARHLARRLPPPGLAEDYAASLEAPAGGRAVPAERGHPFRGRRSPIPAPTAWSDGVDPRCPRARWSRSSERTARQDDARQALASCEPTGAILVDGAPLARLRADDWRRRLSGAFQDFFRFELRARHSVGLGDVPRLDDEAAVSAAVARAGADDVVARLPAGLETQLGPTWPGGVEVSFGQWQKLALARGFMRDRPILLVLDEPTAALDAETEHALFERFAAAARGDVGKTHEEARAGRITILVSHRSRPCAWPTGSSYWTAPASPRSARMRI
jgi:ATP-binding cassette subfamily B protein